MIFKPPLWIGKGYGMFDLTARFSFLLAGLVFIFLQANIQWLTLVVNAVAELLAGFGIAVARAAIGTFLGGVAGTNVVQVGIADDDGRNGSDYQSEKCEWELVAACLVTR